MSWSWLLLAGIAEVAGAAGLKLIQQQPTPWAIAGMLVAMTVSLGCLTLALKGLPLGLAYAVWTGIGVVGTNALSWLVWHEPVEPRRLVFLLLILVGITGLRWSA